jgi:DNA polymerase III subunit beta
MKLLIASTKLAEAARVADLAVQAHNTIPVLDCCRLTAGPGCLSIYGTDLDTGIAARADCDVTEPGEAIVDADQLAKIAAKLRGDVAVTTTAGGLVIKCGRTRFTLAMQSLDDAPAPLAIDGGEPIELTAEQLTALFAGAAAGAATDDKQIYLAGVALFDEVGRLCGVGAHSTMLSYAATAAACPDLGAGVIVHRSTCKTAVELFGKTGATLRISKNLVELASDRARLVAKLVDAVPSAWRSLVPPIAVDNSATVATADLRAALDRCFAVINNLTADLAKAAPVVTLRWGAGELRIAFRYIRTPPAVSDVISAAELAGKAAISVNPRLLSRLLAGIEAESVRLSTGGTGEPLRIDAGADRFVALGQLREFSHVEQEAA